MGRQVRVQVSNFRVTDNRHKPIPEPKPAVITVFVLARLDDEQVLAEAASAETGYEETWRVIEPRHGNPPWVADVDDCVVARTHDAADWNREGYVEDLDNGRACHIAAQDPARTLTRVTAIRALAARHTRSDPRHGAVRCYDCADMCHSYSGMNCDSPDAAWPCEGIRGIAAIWADHPDYDPQWSVGLH